MKPPTIESLNPSISGAYSQTRILPWLVGANARAGFNVSLEVKGREKLLRNPFDKRFTPLEWAQEVKDHLYNIAENPGKELRYI